jgi:SAM-dependent methyltransferase
MSLHKLKQDWEELGQLDPCWAVLTTLPKGQSSQQDLDAFFHSGEEEIAHVMQTAAELGYPVQLDLALDFGCGLGRLTRALAAHFGHCTGLDISESMIAQARQLNASVANVEFILNTETHLQRFPDDHFDLVYTARVLQHLPGRTAIKTYISEFLRILKPGGLLVFQLPSHIPLKNRFQPRRRAYAFLRGLGIGENFLYQKLNLNPMRMEYIPHAGIIALSDAMGAKVLASEQDDKCGPSIQSMTYFLTGK